MGAISLYVFAYPVLRRLTGLVEPARRRRALEPSR